MKSVGYRESGAVSERQGLVGIDITAAALTGRDIWMAVRPVSVNPIDTKIRRPVALLPGQFSV